MLEAAIYYLLKKHFRSQKYYVDLMELFLETTFQTELGQLVDLITAPEDHVDLNKFSLEKYIIIPANAGGLADSLVAGTTSLSFTRLLSIPSTSLSLLPCTW